MKSEWSNYFQTHLEGKAEWPELPLLDKPCVDADGRPDCAVVCGLYTEISDALKLEDKDVQKAMSKTWFCHNHRGKACRGNANRLGLRWVKEAAS